MNKAELITAVAENADITKKDAEKALKAFVDVVTEELKKGESGKRGQKPAYGRADSDPGVQGSEV